MSGVKINRDHIVAETIDNLRRVFQAVSDYSKQAERETGLTGPQLWAVKVINEKGPIKVSDVAKQMYLQPATVVGILDRLEHQNLIERIRSKTDRRIVEVQLTSEGKVLVNRSPDVAQDKLVRGLQLLSEDKLEQISEGFIEFVKILGVEGIPPRLILSNEVNTPASKGRGNRCAIEICSK